MLQWIVIIYLLVINLVLFSMMGYDKKTSKTWELAYSRTPLIDDRTCRWRSRWANGTKRNFIIKPKKTSFFALCYSIGVIAMISCIYLTFK